MAIFAKVNLVARYRANLKSLRGIYIDCGWRAQYHIHYGSRIPYEEFDDNHPTSTIGWMSACRFLYQALKS